MKVIIAVTGASGSIYSKLLIDRLERHNSVENISVVFTDNGKDVWKHETDNSSLPVSNGKIRIYSNKDMFTPMASGSSSYDAMIVVPSSVGMMSRIANGISNDLISRAADVMIKERKKLIIVVRETPLSLIHINNMSVLTQAGAIILPAAVSFYSKPKTIEDLCNTVIDRILKLINIDDNQYEWK